MALGYLKGNIWAGETKVVRPTFFDKRADEKQRHALHMIFSGRAGGFMAEFAKINGEESSQYRIDGMYEPVGSLYDPIVMRVS